MKHLLFFAAVLALIPLSLPALAKGLQCDEAALATAETKASAVPDEMLRQSAQNHLTMAKQSKAANRTDECIEQIGKANAAIGDR